MFTTSACAKVNLDLRVSAVRDDGYHDLRTVFQSVALADVLTLERHAGPFALTCDDPALPLGAENLAMRGARAVAADLGRGLDGWRLHLQKRIPAEAGLGGGSADAVAAARLALAVFDEAWPAHRLRQLLSPLGADVAYFVDGGTVLGCGRGDELTPLPDLPAAQVLLARPSFGVSTREAYGWFDAGPAPPPSSSEALPGEPADWPAFFGSCRNDLQPPVVARHPVLQDGLRRLVDSGAALALMSGSGSALFGVFPPGADLAAAAAGWPATWRVWPTTALSRQEYRGATGVVGPSGPVSPL